MSLRALPLRIFMSQDRKGGTKADANESNYEVCSLCVWMSGLTVNTHRAIFRGGQGG